MFFRKEGRKASGLRPAPWKDHRLVVSRSATLPPRPGGTWNLLISIYFLKSEACYIVESDWFYGKGLYSFCLEAKSKLVKNPKGERRIALETIRTKKMKFVNGKTLIVAVDIGKVSNQGYARCPNGKEVKPFEFFNNGEGFKRFWERIWQAKEINQLETVVVGFESTGPYGEPLVQFLSKRPVRLVQVNPMHTKRLKELEGNSPEKTDRK